jgi:hypothetical protein
MPTTIITGRDITFTIDSNNYDAQATSAILTVDTTINTYQTLDGKAYFTTDTQGTFAVEMLADWGAGSSLCEALWTAAISAPQTPLLRITNRRHRSGLYFRRSTNPTFARWNSSGRTNRLAILYLRYYTRINLKRGREHETTDNNRILRRI